jgi:hypothetical protein
MPVDFTNVSEARANRISKRYGLWSIGLHGHRGRNVHQWVIDHGMDTDNFDSNGVRWNVAQIDLQFWVIPFEARKSEFDVGPVATLKEAAALLRMHAPFDDKGRLWS